MKKIAILVLIVLGFVLSGIVVTAIVRAESTEESTVTTDVTTSSYGYFGYRGCRGGYVFDADDVSYEWLYLRLDPTERDLVDLRQAELISAYDFATLDDGECLAALAEIKAELVDYIVASEFVAGVNP
jgi:hypothetical protein